MRHGEERLEHLFGHVLEPFRLGGGCGSSGGHEKLAGKTLSHSRASAGSAGGGGGISARQVPSAREAGKGAAAVARRRNGALESPWAAAWNGCWPSGHADLQLSSSRTS